MKTYKLRARVLRSDGREWLAEVDADELRRVLIEEGLPLVVVEKRLGERRKVNRFVGLENRMWLFDRRQRPAPRSTVVTVDGNVLSSELLIQAVREALQQQRTWQRRQVTATFAGPNKRGWPGGRRRTDLRVNRRTQASRRHNLETSFWRHPCRNSMTVHLHSAYCPDCGAGYTTVYDRRRRLTDRRLP